MAEGARAGACHLRVPPCGATQRCGDGPTSSCRQEGAWPRRGTRMPLCFGDYAGPRGPGRASLPGCLPPVHALARWALIGARDGRGGNPARFPVSEFPPLRGSKRVIGRRGGGSGRQYARATTRAAGGNARWARWRPRPGTGARRRPSREAPRAQGGDRARSRVSDVRRSGAVGDVSLYEEARRGHLWARGGPFWCRTETLRHPAPRVGPARGRVAHTNPSLTGSMSPTWCPGRGPHAGCFVTSPERPRPLAPAARALSRGGRAEGQQRQLRLVPTAPPRARRRRAQRRW